jgi:hypothetical protein
MSKRIRNMAATIALVALLVPSAAFAQSSDEGYGGPNNNVAGIVEGSGPGSGDTAPAADNGTGTAPKTASGNSLPFTGADLGVLAAAGGFLLAMGFGLRRLTYRPTQS